MYKKVPKTGLNKEERQFLAILELHGLSYALKAKGSTKAEFDQWISGNRKLYEAVLASLQLTHMQYQFLIALEKSPSNIAKACEISGIRRANYYDWIKRDKSFADMVFELEQARIDKAEDALDHLIGKKNFQAIQFLLQTKGKDRGYQPTIEQKLNATHQFNNLSDEELEAEIKRLEQEEATKQTP